MAGVPHARYRSLLTALGPLMMAFIIGLIAGYAIPDLPAQRQAACARTEAAR